MTACPIDFSLLAPGPKMGSLPACRQGQVRHPKSIYQYAFNYSDKKPQFSCRFNKPSLAELRAVSGRCPWVANALPSTVV
jgi:hypothetical protein